MLQQNEICAKLHLNRTLTGHKIIFHEILSKVIATFAHEY